MSLKKGSTAVSYTYDMEGIRSSKTVDGVTHHYVTQNGKIVRESYDNVVLDFIYDANGNPFALSFSKNGGSSFSAFYYLLNAQGDVIGLINGSGELVVSYTYDAWGNILSMENYILSPNNKDLHEVNPLRYRGYYYDNETGWYYLQSRYYDPVVGRFINADGYVSTGTGFLGYNMFAYCMNNPVNMSDPSGNLPRWATIALGAVAAAAAVAVTVVTLGAAAPAAACALTTVGMSIGASYAVASTAATVAVVATTVAAAAYAGDIAYSAVTGDSLLLDTVFQGNADAYNTGLAITNIATAGMLEMAAQSPGVCFVAGTPVLAACGYIAIEEIKAGDMVWAENPDTGEKELKGVVQTFVNESTELIYVYVGNEEIITTPEHPFYSPVKGWVSACDLSAGDVLVLVSGEYITIEKVQHEILEAPITVYNFEVADFHTYYVGKSAVLVHNTCDNYNLNGSKKQGYINKRGWTGDMIVEAINNGRQGSSINKANGQPCTVYRYPGMDNQYVVIENSSRSIVQVSNFNDSNWIPDLKIVWDP